MTKEDDEDFENSTKCWIFDNACVDDVDDDDDVKCHCHITGKYRSSTHIGYSINIKLNQKITVEFHNLKNYDSHLIMQELIKFNLKKKKMLYQTD